MKPRLAWKSAVEIHPADWRFPQGDSWVAGWVWGDGLRFVTDLRAWLDNRPYLGLHGLPRPDIETQLIGETGPPYMGFSFLLNPSIQDKILRLEACDLEGNWSEFFRTAIVVESEAHENIKPVQIAEVLPELVPAILRESIRRPDRSLGAIADTLLSAEVSAPLNAYPNPPFVGALEEPAETGRVKDGRVSVTGWVSHPTQTISRLTAIIDPLQEIALTPGRMREDIVTQFPALGNHANSSFIGQVDLPARIHAPVLLKIFATLGNGEKHLVFAQRFTPKQINRTLRALPMVSRFRFLRASWALLRSARRLGVNRKGALAVISDTWAKYPSKQIVFPSSSRAVVRNNHRLRILAVSHNLNFEGAPRLLFELCRYIARQKNISIELISPHEGPLRVLYEQEGIKVTVHDLSTTYSADSVSKFHCSLDVIGQQIDWDTIDLVLTNTLVSFWGVHLAKQAGKPVQFYIHESAPIERLFAPLVDPSLYPVIQDAVRLATRVVFTADASRQIFSELDRSHFRVLSSWLDIDSIREFMRQHDKYALREKHGYDRDAVLVLNLGTVCERKGQHTFIHATSLLEPEFQEKYPNQNIEFLMVGAREDDYLSAMKALVREADLKHVHFVAETRENYDYLFMADLLVCTSFEESSPRVLLEAAAFGIPIVSTDVNGIPEMLTGKEAWLVEAGDRYHLAAALREALTSHFSNDLARATRAQAKIKRRYDEKTSLPRHLALIRETARQSTE